MKEVIRIPDNKTEEDKPVEVTHYLDSDFGWTKTDSIDNPDKVVYLGRCKNDGDMFAAYERGYIVIYKGHLNSGKY